MTRAAHLLLAGDVLGSLRMHPLVVPAVCATGLLAFTTVWLVWREGSLASLWRDRMTRAAITLFAVVYAVIVAFWLLRFAGLFGGPVPV
jgi:hypothetical protein